MLREPRKQKIDRVSIERKNSFNKHHIQSTRERLAAFDSYKVNKDTDLCGYCAVFMPDRIGGSVMTTVCCAVCEKDMMFSNTNTDVLCSECAIENQLCKHCGGDVELKNRRSKRDFQQ